MKRLLHSLLWLAILTGCNADSTPEPERTLRDMATTSNALADALQSVTDADSAKAALRNLEDKFAAVSDAFQRLPIVMQDDHAIVIFLADPGTMGMRLKELRKGKERLDAEGTRIEALSGLPSEFWKVYTLCEIDVIVGALAANRSPDAGEIRQFFKNVRSLYEKHPYEDVLQIELAYASDDLIKSVSDKLQTLAPDAMIHRGVVGEKFLAFLGPVKDMKAIASAIDFGKVVAQNETRRHLKVELNWEKFATKPNGPGEEAELKREEAEERASLLAEEARQKREEAERRRREAEAKAIAEASELPDPKSADYFDKLADMATTGDPARREKAIEVLLTTSPSDVPSFDTKKKIARAFKKLADDNSGCAKEKAIKGLVLWGGKYCGPILLKMLSTPNPAVEEQIIDALGEIKHAPAATVVATRLGDPRLHQHAFDALQQLGADAEDALIKITRSENQQASLAAIELLGDCGTKKCLPALRKKVANRKLPVDARDACKEAIRKVTTRQKEAKDTDTT